MTTGQKQRSVPKRPARIVIRREWRVGMFTADYRVTCGSPKCGFEDKADEMGAQRLARKHNNDKHGGSLIVKFENSESDGARTRAVDNAGDD